MNIEDYILTFRSREDGLINSIESTYWCTGEGIFRKELMTNSYWGIFLSKFGTITEIRSHALAMEKQFTRGRYNFDGGDTSSSKAASVHYSSYLLMLGCIRKKISINEAHFEEVKKYMLETFFDETLCLNSRVLNQYSRFIEMLYANVDKFSTTEANLVLDNYKILIDECTKIYKGDKVVVQSISDPSFYDFYAVKNLKGLTDAFQITREGIFEETIGIISRNILNLSCFESKHTLIQRVIKKISPKLFLVLSKQIDESQTTEVKTLFPQRLFSGLEILGRHDNTLIEKLLSEKRNCINPSNGLQKLNNPRWLVYRLIFTRSHNIHDEINFFNSKSDNIFEDSEKIIINDKILDKQK